MNAITGQEQEVLDILDRAYDCRGHDLKSSIALSYVGLEKSRNVNCNILIAKCLSKLSLFYMISADNERAISMAEEAINYFKLENDELGVAGAKYSIAGVYYKTNNYHLGMFHLIDCLTIFKKYGDYHNESKTHKSLGTIYEVLGDQTNAISAYGNAIKCAKKLKDLNLESNVYNPLSGIYLKQGKIALALHTITMSVSMKLETGDTRGYAFAVYGRGKILIELGQYDEARSDINEALQIHKNVQDRFGIAMCYNKLALLFIKSSKREQGKIYLEKAIAISEEHNLSIMIYKCNFFMYTILKEEKDDTQALKFLERYLHEKDAAMNSQTLKVIENYERISKIQSKENATRLERQKEDILAKQHQAEQTAAIKQNFLSAMSHEIRTPLNAVTSIISLLKDRSDLEEMRLLDSLKFSAKNLLRIINDILDFSKLESNKIILEERPFHLKGFMERTKETYLSLALEKGIHLNLKIDSNVNDTYKADETKLFQILGNLISNAIKFTDKGCVTISVSIKKSTTNNDQLLFKVIDTGIGIAPAEQTKLFESFYMPQSITTRNDGGTGLGLAIVKKLVELHKSTINLESTVGQGSSFYFTLNLEPTDDLDVSTNGDSQDLTGKVAILAEDNEINALVMDKLLSKWGITLKRARNGYEAISIAQNEKVDFILMDIHMPEMNGFDATHAIRTTKNPNYETPIFALTADVTAAHSHPFGSLFNSFLWKPIEIDRLFETLSQTQFCEKIPR